MSKWGRQWLLVWVWPDGLRNNRLGDLAHLLDGSSNCQFTGSQDADMDLGRLIGLGNFLNRLCWLSTFSCNRGWLAISSNFSWSCITTRLGGIGFELGKCRCFLLFLTVCGDTCEEQLYVLG